MIFVVVEALIPKSQGNEKNIDTVTNATLEGFGVMMMILDVGLG
jgi:ZIP family zinc transporter